MFLKEIEWDGTVEVNGKEYSSSEQASLALSGFSGDLCILFKRGPKPQESKEIRVRESDRRIRVRRYMTQPSTPYFDFHDKWNQGVPMPLQVMRGIVLEETRGMVKMQLHGDPQQTCTCMKCGRLLTNQISKKYGIGPECGGHWYIDPDGETVEQIRERIRNITWTGWIIKSAITYDEEEN